MLTDQIKLFFFLLYLSKSHCSARLFGILQADWHRHCLVFFSDGCLPHLSALFLLLLKYRWTFVMQRVERTHSRPGACGWTGTALWQEGRQRHSGPDGRSCFRGQSSSEEPRPGKRVVVQLDHLDKSSWELIWSTARWLWVIAWYFQNVLVKKVMRKCKCDRRPTWQKEKTNEDSHG